ncbi:hypothetical protein ABWL39_13675 [Chitinivorax sp. PXF-14]|uniref:hypothetical protein n=1 Tax=Chitinivorax sp. PXF-14 TaxID=3230488 RepID=UPI00346674EA
MPDLSDTSTSDQSIYAIHDSKTATIIYVGRTTYARDGERFVEHVNNDVGYPWHKSLFSDVAYQSDDATKWPYYPSKLENCKEFTELETAAAEQYWWEKHGGLSGKLLNKQQPLTLATFNKYRTAKTYRGTSKGFPSGWAPKL